MKSALALIVCAGCALAFPQRRAAPLKALDASQSLRPRQTADHTGSAGGWLDSLLQDPRMNSLKSTLAKIGTPLLPSVKIYKTEQAEPTFKKENVKRTKLWYGPFVLNTALEQQKYPNPAKIDAQSNLFYRKVDGLPTDISVLSSEVTLVYEDGTPTGITNGVFNHHVNFADANKTPQFLTACPGAPPNALFGMSFFAAAAEDQTVYTYTTKDGQLDSGYYVGKDHNVLLTSELVNYTNSTKTVYMIVDMQYVPGKVKMDASFETLSVTQCDSSAPTIALPGAPKTFNMTSKELTMQSDGFIVGARGHLHDGGTNVLLLSNGKVVCESKAQYGSSETDTAKGTTLTSLSVCEAPIPVKKNDKVTVVASYDLTLHPPREHVGGGMSDEMGIMLFGFVRTI